MEYTNKYTEMVIEERNFYKNVLELILKMPTSELNSDGDEQAAHSMQVVAKDALRTYL